MNARMDLQILPGFNGFPGLLDTMRFISIRRRSFTKSKFKVRKGETKVWIT